MRGASQFEGGSFGQKNLRPFYKDFLPSVWRRGRLQFDGLFGLLFCRSENYFDSAAVCPRGGEADAKKESVRGRTSNRPATPGSYFPKGRSPEG